MGRIGRLLQTEIEKFILQTVETHYQVNHLCDQYAPSGDDSPPLAEDRILLVHTDGTGHYAAAGVLTCSQGAKPGERWMYSRSDNGQLQAVVKLLNDGKIQLESPNTIQVQGKTVELNGNSKKLVTWAELNTALQQLVTALISHTHNCTAPGSPSGPPLDALSIDISSAMTTTVATGG